MKDVRKPDVALSSEYAAVGNDPGGRFSAVPERKKGAVFASLDEYCCSTGRTSNIPKPPRTDVLPSWNGSQAKPTRGSKFRNVGFEKSGAPRCGAGSVITPSAANLPRISDGGDAIS